MTEELIKYIKNSLIKGMTNGAAPIIVRNPNFLFANPNLKKAKAEPTRVYQFSAFNIETPWNIIFMSVPAVIIDGQVVPYIAAKHKTSFLERFVSGLIIILALAMVYLDKR